ncbi:MAG: hypothetical protein ACYTGO_04895 [Planctomycetota bacterium]
MLRIAWIEAKALHRVLGFWLLGFLLAWLLLIRLQEPEFFRRQGVPFYWASVQAVLICAFALLPLIWRLGQGPTAARWMRRGALRHIARIVASWLSIVGYGVFLGGVVGLAAITADSICGVAPGWSQLLGIAASGLPPLLVLAALAPGLAQLPLGRTQTIFTWLVLMALVLHLLWPGWAWDKPLVDVLSVLQATAAALLVSLAVTLHRVRPWPSSHAHRHSR